MIRSCRLEEQNNGGDEGNEGHNGGEGRGRRNNSDLTVGESGTSDGVDVEITDVKLVDAGRVLLSESVGTAANEDAVTTRNRGGHEIQVGNGGSTKGGLTERAPLVPALSVLNSTASGTTNNATVDEAELSSGINARGVVVTLSARRLVASAVKVVPLGAIPTVEVTLLGGDTAGVSTRYRDDVNLVGRASDDLTNSTRDASTHDIPGLFVVVPHADKRGSQVAAASEVTTDVDVVSNGVNGENLSINTTTERREGVGGAKSVLGDVVQEQVAALVAGAEEATADPESTSSGATSGGNGVDNTRANRGDDTSAALNKVSVVSNELVKTDGAKRIPDTDLVSTHPGDAVVGGVVDATEGTGNNDVSVGAVSPGVNSVDGRGSTGRERATDGTSAVITAREVNDVTERITEGDPLLGVSVVASKTQPALVVNSVEGTDAPERVGDITTCTLDNLGGETVQATTELSGVNTRSGVEGEDLTKARAGTVEENVVAVVLRSDERNLSVVVALGVVRANEVDTTVVNPHGGTIGEALNRVASLVVGGLTDEGRGSTNLRGNNLISGDRSSVERPEVARVVDTTTSEVHVVTDHSEVSGIPENGIDTRELSGTGSVDAESTLEVKTVVRVNNNEVRGNITITTVDGVAGAGTSEEQTSANHDGATDSRAGSVDTATDSGGAQVGASEDRISGPVEVVQTPSELRTSDHHQTASHGKDLGASGLLSGGVGGRLDLSPERAVGGTKGNVTNVDNVDDLRARRNQRSVSINTRARQVEVTADIKSVTDDSDIVGRSTSTVDLVTNVEERLVSVVVRNNAEDAADSNQEIDDFVTRTNLNIKNSIRSTTDVESGGEAGLEPTLGCHVPSSKRAGGQIITSSEGSTDKVAEVLCRSTDDKQSEQSDENTHFHSGR